MLTEWSVECSDEDPVLVVPWSSDDPDGPAFIDLRANPYDLDSIPEADRHPPLMQALRALNAPSSPVFTAKCDVWSLDPEELADLRLNLDLLPEEFPAGFASYIDLLWRDRALFTSFHRHEQLLTRFTRRAAPLDHSFAAIEFVLRPALIDLDGPREGYAFTLYVKALGPDPRAASDEWAATLSAAVALVRASELTRGVRPRTA